MKAVLIVLQQLQKYTQSAQVAACNTPCNDDNKQCEDSMGSVVWTVTDNVTRQAAMSKCLFV